MVVITQNDKYPYVSHMDYMKAILQYGPQWSSPPDSHALVQPPPTLIHGYANKIWHK